MSDSNCLGTGLRPLLRFFKCNTHYLPAAITSCDNGFPRQGSRVRGSLCAYWLMTDEHELLSAHFLWAHM